MTIFFNQTLDVPFAGMILQRNPVNISIVAGNDPITLTLYDPSGTSYPFSVSAGQKLQQEKFNLFRFEIEGSGQAAIAISYPEIIDPSIEVTLNPNNTQAVTSPQLPASLDSNGNFLIRHLTSLDIPSRSWNLGSSDVPNRGWTLGSGDTPDRSWALTSSDIPGRSWTLGGSDAPDVSTNQTNNFKTDIGQANTYLKDVKIPYAMNQDTNGTIGVNLSSSPTTTTITFTGDGKPFLATPPTGYRWKLRSITYAWTAANTVTVYPQCQLYPTSLSTNGLNVFFSSLSVTSGDNYIVDAAEYVQARSNTFIGLAYVTEIGVGHDFYVYPNETLKLLIGDEAATVTATISYSEERIS